MNTNWAIRDEIIFGKPLPWFSENDDEWEMRKKSGSFDINGLTLGGISHFENLTLDKIKVLLEKDFIEGEECQNHSPSTNEFVKFVEKYPQINFIGYAVSPERDDYRVTITGLVCKIGVTEKLISEFESIFGNADEITVKKNYLRCWYD